MRTGDIVRVRGEFGFALGHESQYNAVPSRLCAISKALSTRTRAVKLPMESVACRRLKRNHRMRGGRRLQRATARALLAAVDIAPLPVLTWVLVVAHGRDDFTMFRLVFATGGKDRCRLGCPIDFQSAS